jgi:hypothetical protein
VVFGGLVDQIIDRRIAFIEINLKVTKRAVSEFKRYGDYVRGVSGALPAMAGAELAKLSP